MTAVARDANGRILPGASLNPGGRIKLPQVLRDAAPEACAKLVAIMRGEFIDERVSAGQAAQSIIERTIPRPAPDSGDGGLDRLAMFFSGSLERLAAARALVAADEAEEGEVIDA